MMHFSFERSHSSPPLSSNRRTLFLLKLGSFQFAVLKIAFTILSIVLYTNDLFDLSDVSALALAPASPPFASSVLFDLLNVCAATSVR